MVWGIQLFNSLKREAKGQGAYSNTAEGVAIDEGLRAYMLKVYNYMTIG